VLRNLYVILLLFACCLAGTAASDALHAWLDRGDHEAAEAGPLHEHGR
jgi:hypothetical protein